MWTIEFSWFAQLLRAKCLICKPVSELRVRSKRNGGAVKGVSHPTCWKFFLAPGDGVDMMIVVMEKMIAICNGGL